MDTPLLNVLRKVIFFSLIIIITLSSISSAVIANNKITDRTTLYSEKQVNISFESSGYTLYGEIYYPSDESEVYPGIVFCEGLGGFIDAYNWLPKAIASQGYVVLIYDPPGQGRSEGVFPARGINLRLLNLYYRFGSISETIYHYFSGECVLAARDAITYLTEESPVKNIVNDTCIGLVGHSLGGITVSEAAAIDDRVDAVIALSHANPQKVKDIDIPIQFQVGGFDIPLFSVPILRRCYSKAQTPKEIITIKHGTHWGFTTAFGPLCPCPRWQKDICIQYSIGWFDYFLKNKQEAYNTITTGTDHLSRIVKSKYNFGDGDIILE